MLLNVCALSSRGSTDTWDRTKHEWMIFRDGGWRVVGDEWGAANTPPIQPNDSRGSAR